MSAQAKRFFLIALVPASAVVIAIVLMARGKWLEKTLGPPLPAFDAAELSLHDATDTLVTKSLNPADLAWLRAELEAAKRVRNTNKLISLPGVRLFQAGVEVKRITLLWDGYDRFLFGIDGKDYQSRPGSGMRDLLEINGWPRR